MKFKFLILCLLASFSKLSYSQVTYKKEITCGKTEIVFTILLGKFQEKPILYGKSSEQAETTIALWMSPDKTFTITSTIDNVTCILESGTDLLPMKNPIKPNS